MTTDSADYCMRVNDWVWSKLRVCRLEVDMGSGLEYSLVHWIGHESHYSLVEKAMANSAFKAFTGHCPTMVINRALVNIAI